MINIALVGNPNTGKTTLFNALTNSFEHVGNWHGVTVDKKDKIFEYQGSKFKLIDLPGTYSLSAYSFEEQVTINGVLNENAKIINLCDVNALERNLYLTLQLIEAKVDFVLAVNMVKKEDKYKNLKLKLKSVFGDKVVLCNGQSSLNIDKLVNSLIIDDKINIDLPYLKNFEELAESIKFNASKQKLNKYFCAIKLCEYDEEIEERLNLNSGQLLLLKRFREKFQVSDIAKFRYDYIRNLLQVSDDKIYGVSKIDTILLNRFLALPIFVLIMLAIFYVTFDSIGVYLSDCLNLLIKDILGYRLVVYLESLNISIVFIDFLNKCLINGVGGILAFLPQIALLFLFISILEETGYLSRLAFMFEDWLCKFGLSGKSIFTLIMGFGCTTSAMFTANNLEDSNAKIKTILLTPFMSCSAKLPIYAVFCGAFFNQSICMIFLLYFIGIFAAGLLALILENTKLKSTKQSFILEFPPYRIPNIKNVFKVIYINVLHFISKVGSVLLIFGIVVWFLQSFTFDFRFVNGDNISMLQTISQIFAPVFKPLGFGEWGAVSALLCGLVAKEIVVSTLAMINSVNISNSGSSILSISLIASTSAVHFSGESALSFMVFCLLYPPCISSISVMKSQIGKKITILGLLLQLAIAYVVSFLVYNICKYFNFVILIILFIILCVCLIVLVSISYYERNNVCQICKQKYCNNCFKVYK